MAQEFEIGAPPDIGPDQTRAHILKNDEILARDSAESLAAQAPPPTEPLEVSYMKTLADRSDAVLEILSDGQVPPMPDMVYDEDGLPSELFVILANLSAFIDAHKEDVPGLSEYSFSPEVRDNNDLVALIGKVDRMAQDRTLRRQLRSAAKTIERQTAASYDEPPAAPPQMSNRDRLKSLAFIEQKETPKTDRKPTMPKDYS